MPHFFLATAVAVVDALYWAIFKERDMRMPPKPWWNLALAAIGGVAGSYAAVQFGGSDDLLTATLGAFVGGRLFNGTKEMINPQPFPPSTH